MYSTDTTNIVDRSMASEEIYQFLMEIVETDRTGTIDKLAALSYLNKLFNKDTKVAMTMKCANSDFSSTLATLIETGLLEHQDPAVELLVSVAMEILYTFTQLPVASMQRIVSKPVIRILLGYTNLSGTFYAFPRKMKQTVSKVCENKHLIGKVKVVAMSTETLEYIHRHTNNELQR